MATSPAYTHGAVDAADAAARIRAARAYANLSQAQIAAVLGVSVVTIKRIEKGTRPCSLDELFAIADTCDVPREFMTDGFASSPDTAMTVEVVRAAVAAATESLHTRIDDLELLTRGAADMMRSGSARGTRRRSDTKG